MQKLKSSLYNALQKEWQTDYAIPNMDTFMENSASSNVWTYYARWHRYFASLIETNVFEISCLLCISFCFVNFM